MAVIWHHCGDFSSENVSGQTIVGSRILRYLVENRFNLRVFVYNASNVIDTELFLLELGVADVTFIKKNWLSRLCSVLFSCSGGASVDLNIFGTVAAIDFVQVVPSNSTLLAGDLETRKFWQRPRISAIAAFVFNSLRQKKFRLFQNVIFYSSYDNDAYAGSNSCVVPIGYDFTPAIEPVCNQYLTDLVFTGNFNYEPNFLAADWLLRFLKGKKYSISLVGYNASLLSSKSLDASVKIASDVLDINEYIRSAKIFVCPLFLGTGMKNKLLAAMECGVPIVCTPLSVEGFDSFIRNQVHLADSEDTFITAIDSILADYDAALERASGLRLYVLENYSWDVVLNQFVAELTSGYSQSSCELTDMSH